MLFFEHKHLYHGASAGRARTPSSTARTHKRQAHLGDHLGRDGLYRRRSSSGAREDGVSVEVVDLRGHAVGQKLRSHRSKTSKVLVLHGHTHDGFGAKIDGRRGVQEQLDAPVKRVAAPDTPVPFAPPLEKAFIPQVEDVVRGLRELAEY